VEYIIHFNVDRIDRHSNHDESNAKMKKAPRVATLKTVCVFCGSNFGRSYGYRVAVKQLAKVLCERNITLVYGGTNTGTMGLLASSVLKSGGQVVGIIPKFMVSQNLAYTGLTKLHIVSTMHTRKKTMSDISNGFLILPGGIGTLDEFFETWNWRALGVHKKPIGLLNVNGYFNKLVEFIETMVAEKFISDEDSAIPIIERTPSLLLDRMSKNAL
jgi:uncharacterized protein (TIGR00730 family)